MANIPTVIFSYRVDDILEEITKRTSKLGQMRTAEGPSLVDRLSLTRGEDFMFSEFLEDAVSQTYDWLKAFGRKIPMYEKIVLKYEDMEIYKDYGVSMDIAGEKKDFDTEMRVKVLSFNTDNISTIEVKHEELNLLKERNKDVNVNVLIHHRLVSHLIVGGVDAINESEYTKTVNMSTGDSYTSGLEEIYFNVKEPERFDVKSLELYITATVLPVNIQPIKSNTYVEYHTDFGDESVFDVYQTNVNCTTANWKDYSCKLAIDPRDKIVFILENSCNMDMNLMSSIDRNIKEALVNYIIWRWFEYTNPQEADRFYVKFEAYASEAKNGMDSEREIMQRTYNINR